VFHEGCVRLQSPAETLRLGRRRSGEPLSALEQSVARRAVSLLRFGLDAGDRKTIEAAQALVSLLDGQVKPSARRTNALSVSVREELVRRLGAELSRGRLFAEVEKTTTERPEPSESALSASGISESADGVAQHAPRAAVNF